MKKHILILLLLASAFLSCTRYLGVKPYGMIIPKTPEEFDALIQPHLKDIDQGKENMVLIPDGYTALSWDLYGDDYEPALRGDQASAAPFFIGTKIELSSNSLNEYGKLYAIIKDANIVIDGIGESADENAQKTLSASYALRGIAYYQLMRLYCEPISGDPLQMGVPMVRVFDMEAQVPRGTVSELKSAIESDLLKALSYDPQDPAYLFTSDVLRGYLARLYFWTEEWAKAAETAGQLLAKYPLLPREAFVKMMTTASKSGNTLIKIAQGTLNVTIQAQIDNIQKYFPLSLRFTTAFSDYDKAHDIRYTSWVDKKLHALKPPYSGLRSAELLLIQAEAEYHLGHHDKALSLINDLRRHRIDGYTPISMNALPEAPERELITEDASGKAITPLLALILSERRKELLNEGDRFFELKRNGRPEFWKALDGYRYDMKAYMYTLPIPLDDLYLQESLIQNPEYDKYTTDNKD